MTKTAHPILLATIARSLQSSAATLLDVGQKRQEARLVRISAQVNGAADDLLAMIDAGAGKDERYDHDDERRQ